MEAVPGFDSHGKSMDLAIARGWLCQSTGRLHDMSAAELARELDETHANASYHLRTLAAAGLVDLAEERAVRGGRERRYRTAQPVSPPPGPPAPDAGQQWLTALTTELSRRWPSRDPQAPKIQVDAELWVEPEVWEQALSGVRAAMDLLHQRARPPRSPGTVQTSTTLSAFRMRP